MEIELIKGTEQNINYDVCRFMQDKFVAMNTCQSAY